MTSRLGGLQRLDALYETLEEMRWSELERSAVALRDADAAIAMQRTMGRSARFDEREALAAGDRLELTIADKRREISIRNVKQLEKLRATREQMCDAACEMYQSSRIRSEQMKQLRDAAMKQVQVEEGRRQQAAADDRFLARRQWR